MSEPTVTTNAPQKPNAMGGAPTTTQDVSGQITPNPTPTPTPSAQPTTPAQPTAPAQPSTPAQQPRPAQPATQQPTPRGLHASIFEGVLKTLGGGTQFINRTDPVTGATTREPVQQSKGQLGKSILAGAIAGMFGGMGARDAEGRHDPLKAAQEGFVAGQKPVQERVAQLQATADEDTSRRQMVMKNNMDLMHQQIAMTHMQHQELASTADNNNKGILADAGDFDKNLTGTDVNDPTKKAIQGRGLTYQEALAKLKGNWSNTLAIVDGYQDVRGPNGEMEPEPTYAVLNPNVTIKMSEDQAAAMAKFKPAYANAYQATGGNLKIPLNRYVADTHQLNSLNQVEAYFENIKDQIPGMKNAPDLSALARDPKGGKQVLNAVNDVENAIGQGGDPVAALQRLAGTGGGALILKDMGITNEQVQTLVNDKTRKEALAKEGGMGPKAPMPDDTVAALLTAADASNIPQETKDAIHAGAKKDAQGHYNLNMQQGEDLRNRVLTAQNQTNQINERNLLANGDPSQMQKTAQNTIEGDVNDITKVASMRGNARSNAVNAMHDAAANLGLDTTNYSESALESQANMWKDYTGGQKTPTGKQLVSFDGFIGHTGAALAAQQRVADKFMGLYHQPILNMTMKEIGSKLTDDADWAAYSASLEPVKHEIENFLAAGFATKSEDAQAMRAIINDTLPINRMNATLKQLAETADVRLAALGKAYTNNMGRNFNNLLSPDSQKTLQKLGVPSQSAAYTAKLPRGWNNHQLTQLTDKNVAKQFLQASGGNIPAARELMKRNGWSE
jgi:hypothetical protein